MQETVNYKFKKPEDEDFWNVKDFADMMDAVDTELKKVAEEGSSVKIDATLSEEGQAADAKATGTALELKANKYRARSITLPAASWTGEAAPYICRAEVEGVTENNDIQVLPSFAWTQEEAESWAGAMVLSGSQEVNTLILKAYRDKPMVDLTVTVLIGDEVTKGGE